MQISQVPSTSKEWFYILEEFFQLWKLVSENYPALVVHFLPEPESVLIWHILVKLWGADTGPKYTAWGVAVDSLSVQHTGLRGLRGRTKQQLGPRYSDP